MVLSIVLFITNNAHFHGYDIEWGGGKVAHSEYIAFSAYMKLLIYLWVPFSIAAVSNYFNSLHLEKPSPLKNKSLLYVLIALVCLCLFIGLSFKNGPTPFFG